MDILLLYPIEVTTSSPGKRVMVRSLDGISVDPESSLTASRNAWDHALVTLHMQGPSPHAGEVEKVATLFDVL